MNLKKTLFYIVAVAIVALVIMCSKEHESDKTGQVQISLALDSEISLLKSQTMADAIFDSADVIVVSIQNEIGETVKELLELPVIHFNGEIISKPISLPVGNYFLSACLVLDEADNAIFASPLEGSELAYLVEIPLPIPFTIKHRQIIKIVPEVLNTQKKKPYQFGYVTFSLKYIDTFDFLISATVLNEQTNEYELTDAQVAVIGDGDTIYKGNISAIGDNQITIKDGYKLYEIVVINKDCFKFKKAYLNAELRRYFEFGPIIAELLADPCDCISAFSYSGKVYHTVVIGKQCWMKENLDYNVSGSSYYNDDPVIGAIYGRLYEWGQIMNGASSSNTNPSGVQGICPSGWHIPSKAEFEELINTVGGSATGGGALKEAGFTHWNSPNAGANNSSGFTALPAGYMSEGIPPDPPDEIYTGLGNYASFWSSYKFEDMSCPGCRINEYPTSLHLTYDYDDAYLYSTWRYYKLSVRCVKD